jgi:hypothetical protein
MNEPSFTTRNDNLQPRRPRYCPPREDPLRGAMIATASQKLHLRRLRGVLTGPLKTATVTRLLNVNDCVFRALEWLRGGPVATDDSLDELEQLAMDTQAMPDSVGVAQ